MIETPHAVINIKVRRSRWLLSLIYLSLETPHTFTPNTQHKTKQHIMPQDIAQSSHVVPRLEALMMGTSDLTNDLHARHTADRSPLLYSLSKCVVAARAFRLRVIDGVFLDLNDAEVSV